jgi:serine/threonine-protein kinase
LSSARYAVSEKIDSGGMAEVWMGRARTNDGFVRPVAIKRVLPHLVGDAHFVQMFLDEARLALHLSHGNIVQTLDVGSAAGVHYLVMEWVDGLNLRAFQARNDGPLPIALAGHIACSILTGLAYAHEAADHEGEPLNIVHRDISPPNVLLSRSGEVKIVDFGLARARGHAHRTRPGVVKGKFAYLSPETVRGGRVDRRADVFATGVVLWEMLAGDRLFRAPTDKETLERVTACVIPPLGNVPPAVETVLRRALARDPANRFPNARAFHEALVDALPLQALKFTPFDLADQVQRAMPDAAPQISTAPVGIRVPIPLLARLARVAPSADPLIALDRGLLVLEAEAGITGDRRSGPDRRRRRRDPGGRRHTDRAAFVERVLTELHADRSAADLAAELNAEGLRTGRGTLWTAKSLGQLARRARQRRAAELR